MFGWRKKGKSSRELDQLKQLEKLKYLDKLEHLSELEKLEHLRELEKLDCLKTLVSELDEKSLVEQPDCSGTENQEDPKSRDIWLINSPMFHLLWRNRNRYIPHLIYVLIPFILIVMLGVLVITSGAHEEVSEGEHQFYSFFQDYTNCFMVSYIFFFMYFVNGKVVWHFNKKTDAFLNRMTDDNKKKQYKKNLYVTCIVCTVLYLSGIFGATWFINVAELSGGESYWYHKLFLKYDKYGLWYYKFIISIAWCLSIRLFVSIVCNSVVIYKATRTISSKPKDSEKNWFESSENRKETLKPLVNHLAAALGFGVYFLIAVGMIMYSDFRAHDKFINLDLKFAVYQHRWIIVAITLLLSAFYFSTVIITYVAVTNMINNNSLGGKKGKSRRIDANSFGVFLLTVIFPGMAAILQILVPLWKWAN